MDKINLERLYEENGLHNYKLRNLEDLYKIHSININQIEGYNKLSNKEKEVFSKFIINYFNKQLLEDRKIVPIQIYKSYEFDSIKLEIMCNGEKKKYIYIVNEEIWY